MHESSSGLPPRLRLSWFAESTVGLVRTNNEDAYRVARVPDSDAVAEEHPASDKSEQNGKTTRSWGETLLDRPGLLVAVADGMGGALAGEVASGMAVETIAEAVARQTREGVAREGDHDTLQGVLWKAVQEAHSRIRDEGQQNPERMGMGTTLTGAWLLDNVALLAHVGDSRAYLFRRGRLQQITRDQSLVEKLLEDEIITEEEAREMRRVRNVILQALGCDDDIEIQGPQILLEPGDALLLCTDGLTGVLENEDVERCLQQGGRSRAQCERLVQAAEGGGGPDNITVVVGQVLDARKQ